MDFVKLSFRFHDDSNELQINVRSFGSLDIYAYVTDKTGCEMEAMVGVTTAALTIYDMCKGIDKGIIIRDVKLKSKTGGKSGDFFAK